MGSKEGNSWGRGAIEILTFVTDASLMEDFSSDSLWESSPYATRPFVQVSN